MRWVCTLSSDWNDLQQIVQSNAILNIKMEKYVDLKEISRSGGKYARLKDEGSTEVLRRANVMPQLQRKSSELRRSDLKKKSRDGRDDYQTDCRRVFENDLELQELRKLVSECEHCRSRLPEFITKKPLYEVAKVRDAEAQATLDAGLFKLLEDKIEEIGRYSRHTAKELKKMEEQVRIKEEDLDQMEQRFTGVVYRVSEDILLFQQIQQEYNHMKALVSNTPEVPSFLKALALDNSVQTANHG